MASIEGMDVYAVDVCTSPGQACVYNVSYDGSHSALTIGVCTRHTKFENGIVRVYFTCD